ncbi:MAG TPA: hypothetical protein VGL88_11325 [Pseudonocardiaceae bacterium]
MDIAAGLRVPDPQFPRKTPAGHRSSVPLPLQAPGGQPDPKHLAGGGTTSEAHAAGRALCNYFLANADCGDNAVNDQLVAELVRRTRMRQAARDDEISVGDD